MTFEQWLQSRLTAHGFAVGEIDGVIGDNTKRALVAFQRAMHLPETGTSDDRTIAALRMASSLIADGNVPKRDVGVAAAIDVGAAKIWPRQSECAAFYGAVGTRQTAIEIPFDMYLAWDKGSRIRKMTVHSRVAYSAGKALASIAGAYSAPDRRALGIDLFGGSLNVRRMRGGSAYSMHSWGIAIDFDPERNGLNVPRPTARLSHDDAKPFWAAWEMEGWLSLGRARNFDWMHVQAARL